MSYSPSSRMTCAADVRPPMRDLLIVADRPPAPDLMSIPLHRERLSDAGVADTPVARPERHTGISWSTRFLWGGRHALRSEEHPPPLR
jgi:hypothetical protein